MQLRVGKWGCSFFLEMAEMIGAATTSYLDSRRLEAGISENKGAASAVGDRIVSVDIHLRQPDGSFPQITPEILTRARVAAFHSFGDKLAAPDVSQGIVVMGLPCSGKSHLVRELAKKHPDTVFFEATLSTHQERLSLADAARHAGKPIHVIRVRAELEICLKRNQQREGTRRLPDQAMLGMMRNLAQQPPSIAEGFASVTSYSGLSIIGQMADKAVNVSRFDLRRMTYVSTADDHKDAGIANPIPMLATLFERNPKARVGFVHGVFARVNNGHLAMLKNAAAFVGPDDKPLFDLVVVEPVLADKGKPGAEVSFTYRTELLRRAVADEPSLASRVVVTDVQGRVPGFPSEPLAAMNVMLEAYDPQRQHDGRFTFIQGADRNENDGARAFGPKGRRPDVKLMVVERAGYTVADPTRASFVAGGAAEPVAITSSEIIAAVRAKDLTSIAARVPRTVLRALEAEVAISDIPLLTTNRRQG